MRNLLGERKKIREKCLGPMGNARMTEVELFSHLYFTKILVGRGFYGPGFIPWLVFTATLGTLECKDRE